MFGDADSVSVHELVITEQSDRGWTARCKCGCGAAAGGGGYGGYSEPKES